MKLTTIWTIPAMSLRERLHRTWDEWFLPKVAHHLPARLAFYSFIDSGVRTIRSDETVPEVTFMTLLERHHGGRP